MFAYDVPGLPDLVYDLIVDLPRDPRSPELPLTNIARRASFATG